MYLLGKYEGTLLVLNMYPPGRPRGCISGSYQIADMVWKLNFTVSLNLDKQHKWDQMVAVWNKNGYIHAFLCSFVGCHILYLAATHRTCLMIITDRQKVYRKGNNPYLTTQDKAKFFCPLPIGLGI